MTTTPSTAEHAASRACYLRGCPEAACRAYHLRYCKEYDLRRHRGERRRIDATEAANHLRALIADGWTQKGIQAAASVPDHTICGLVNGIHTQVYRETAEKILAFQPDPDAQRLGHWIDPTGTIRRVQALAVLGYPTYVVADSIGMAHATLKHIVAGRREKVGRPTARKVAELYSRWMTRPGPSETARRMAASRGWYGPLAWDDIDNPEAEPDTEGIGYDGASRKRDDLRTEEIKHLASFGYSDYAIAKQIGLPEKDVHSRLLKIRAAQAQKATQPEQVAA